MKVIKAIVQFAVAFTLLAGLLGRVPAAAAQTQPSPVLLVVNSSGGGKYGPFIGEILRAEGLNGYDQAAIGSMNAALLAQYSLVILGRTALTSAQANDLRAYVNGGGRLIAFRPDAQIADLFGLGGAVGTQTDGYMKIQNAAVFDGQTPGAGLETQSLQIHGTSDRYNLMGGSVMLAELYTGATTGSGYPAVSAFVYGSGQAVAFLYDLPENIILTRQGNPANANIDADGDGILRTIDLFQRQGGGAPWVDLNRVPIPQADEQQRFFARLVRQLAVAPLPQLWYFPGTSKTMLILTGDAHANPTSYYQTELSSINAYGAKITLYMSIAGEPTDTNVQTWRSQGHEFGIHPYAYKPDSYPPYNVTNLSEGYNAMETWFSLTFSSPKSRTVRNHQIAWLGYTDAVDIQAAHNIALDTNFYAWGTWLQKADGTWAHGYTTGSGLPMKFVKLDGTILPVFQQNTQLVDEQMILGAGNHFENLTGVQGQAVSKALIDASQAGYYSALMTQFHIDYYSADARVWAEQTMAYAQSLGIPMWNADRWLSFTETRHDASYSNLAWNALSGQLTFNLNSAATSGIQLSTLLPAAYGGKNLVGVQVDGVNTAFQTMLVKGVQMAVVSVPAGNHSFSVQYQPAPPTATPTATITPGGPTLTPTFTATPLPPTATATNTPLPPTATPTPIPTNGSVTQTSFADFGQACAVTANTHITDIGGGAVALAAAFADDFNGAALDGTLWASGNWSGGAYTPLPNLGILQVNAPLGGWVRSVPAFTHGTIEAVAEFGNGAYQHIGFGSDGFVANRYFLFSTFSGNGHLYARANNNTSEQNVDLGVLLAGMHRYRIEWTALDAATDQVTFFLDGVQVAQMAVPNAGAANFYVYMSNALDAPALRVDSIQLAPTYLSSGTYTSCVLDAGAGYTWNSISWDAAAPAGTSTLVEYRTSADGAVWSAWTAAASPAETLLAAPMQFAQYRLSLGTIDPAQSPLVNSVTLGFALVPAPPTATPLPPTATSTPLPPTATPTGNPPATATPLPPTATPLPPTATPLPPTATPLPPTATPTQVSAGFPQNPVLDNFNRANGSLGTSWRGATSSYQIASNRVDVIRDGDIYRNTAFGVNQEVFITLSTIDVNASEIDLLLKAQSNNNYQQGVIEVLYAPALNRVEVWTYSNAQNWVQRGANIPVTFANGDQFGASATADGTVSVYKNGLLLATRSVAGWTYNSLGGYTGFWVVHGNNTFLDDFGAGNITVGPLPTSTPTSTPTATPLPPTATNTPLPPTATSTGTLLLPTATNTPLPPTATSTPLPPTPTATLSDFPGTAILDNFNRANGPIGANWAGRVNDYTVSINQLDVSVGGDVYWTGIFGTGQEVFVTLTQIDPDAAEIDLLLKSQSNTWWGQGVIEVFYSPVDQAVSVYTFSTAQGWVQYGAAIPVTFLDGDQFGARVAPNGTVSVYRNGLLLGTRSVAAWTFNNQGGYIGLWIDNGSQMIMDDFGGGNR